MDKKQVLLKAVKIGEGCSINLNCTIMELMAIMSEAFATVITDTAKRHGVDTNVVLDDFMDEFKSLLYGQIFEPLGTRIVLNLDEKDCEELN